MSTKHLTPVELKFDAADAERGLVKGYGAVFGNLDAYRDVISPGAFRAGLQGKGTLPMLWSHDMAEPIGLWTSVAEDARGLRVEGRLNLAVQRAREARALVMQGAATGLSMGYFVRASTPGKGPVRRYLTAVDVVEVSIVVLPANAKARVDGIKAGSPPPAREFETALREVARLTHRQARLIAGAGARALADPEDREGLRQIAAELRARATAIRG